MATKRQIHMMTAVVVLAALLMVAAPGQAQETVTGPPDSLAVWVGYLVAGVVLATFAFAAWVQHTNNARVRTLVDTLTVAIQELSASVPQAALRPGQELIGGGVDAGYDYVRRRVTERTPTLRDDELLDEAERRTENLLRKLGLLAGPIDYDANPDAVATFEARQPGDVGPLAGPASGQ